ncbi:MAG: Smr/MutS family protein [Pseudomonadota bacterium]
MTDSVTPLKPTVPETMHDLLSSATPSGSASSKPVKPQAASTRRVSEKLPASVGVSVRPARRQKNEPPAGPQSIDKKLKVRLGRGRDELDGRIDLHGMTQRQAHSALMNFIRYGHFQGWRNVLVITGKGKSDPKSRDLLPDETADIGQGVLRRRVPEWLRDPALRPFVVGFDEAHQRHGGGGALYVRLRRKNP